MLVIDDKHTTSALDPYKDFLSVLSDKENEILIKDEQKQWNSYFILDANSGYIRKNLRLCCLAQSPQDSFLNLRS